MRRPSLTVAGLTLLLIFTNAVWLYGTRPSTGQPAHRLPLASKETSPGKWVRKSAFVTPLLPDDLHVDPYLAGLLQCVAFLELSDAEAVDPDAAVEVMENVTTYLARLPPKRVDELGRSLRRISEHGKQVGYPKQFIELVDDFQQSFDVGTESD